MSGPSWGTSVINFRFWPFIVMLIALFDSSFWYLSLKNDEYVKKSDPNVSFTRGRNSTHSSTKRPNSVFKSYIDFVYALVPVLHVSCINRSLVYDGT